MEAPPSAATVRQGKIQFVVVSRSDSHTITAKVAQSPTVTHGWKSIVEWDFRNLMNAMHTVVVDADAVSLQVAALHVTQCGSASCGVLYDKVTFLVPQSEIDRLSVTALVRGSILRE